MILPVVDTYVNINKCDDGSLSRTTLRKSGNGASLYEIRYLNGSLAGQYERIATLNNDNPLRKLGVENIGKSVYKNSVEYYIKDKNSKEIFSGNLKELKKFIKTIRK